MAKQATFDPSKRLDLYFRINRDGSKRFTFLDPSGGDYDITAINFEIFIKDYAGSKVKVISLTLGDGLEIPTYEVNKLDASITADDTLLNEGEYYWELYLIGQKKTWLSGKAYFHNGEFDGVDNSSETLTMETVTITINDSVSGTSYPFIRWDFAVEGGFPTDLTKVYIATDDSVYPENTWFASDGVGGWYTK
jgi:hypothetical protein